MYVPELYSIVRGRVGKTVEFGLSWGIRRLRGGYLLATMASTKNELHDTRFALSAINEHKRARANRRRHRLKIMGACGQLAALGFNLNKVVRELAKRDKRQLVG